MLLLCKIYMQTIINKNILKIVSKYGGDGD